MELDGKYCDIVNEMDLTDIQKDNVKDLLARVINEVTTGKTESVSDHYVCFIRHATYTGNKSVGYEKAGTIITLTHNIEQRNKLADRIKDELDEQEGFGGGAVGMVGGKLRDEYIRKYKFWNGISDPCLI